MGASGVPEREGHGGSEEATDTDAGVPPSRGFLAALTLQPLEARLV